MLLISILRIDDDLVCVIDGLVLLHKVIFCQCGPIHLPEEESKQATAAATRPWIPCVHIQVQNVLEPFDSLEWQQWDYRKTQLFLGTEQRREIFSRVNLLFKTRLSPCVGRGCPWHVAI
jgi:hypothetical protein